MSTEKHEKPVQAETAFAEQEQEGSPEIETVLGKYSVTDDQEKANNWNLSDGDTEELKGIMDNLVDFCRDKGLPMAAMVIAGSSIDEDGDLCCRGSSMYYEGVAADKGDLRPEGRRAKEMAAVQQHGLNTIIESQIPRILQQFTGGLGEEDGE